MICGKCKAKIDNGLESCPVCGARFKKREPQTPVESPRNEAVKEDLVPKESLKVQETSVDKDVDESSQTVDLVENNKVDAKIEETFFADTNGDESQSDDIIAKPKKSFISIVSPFLENASRVLSILALALILTAIVAAKVLLIKTSDNTIEGALKISVAFTVPALMLGLAATAAAVLKSVLPVGEGVSKKSSLIATLPTLLFALVMTFVAFISVIL